MDFSAYLPPAFTALLGSVITEKPSSFQYKEEKGRITCYLVWDREARKDPEHTDPTSTEQNDRMAKKKKYKSPATLRRNKSRRKLRKQKEPTRTSPPADQPAQPVSTTPARTSPPADQLATTGTLEMPARTSPPATPPAVVQRSDQLKKLIEVAMQETATKPARNTRPARKTVASKQSSLSHELAIEDFLNRTYGKDSESDTSSTTHEFMETDFPPLDRTTPKSTAVSTTNHPPPQPQPPGHRKKKAKQSLHIGIAPTCRR